MKFETPAEIELWCKVVAAYLGGVLANFEFSDEPEHIAKHAAKYADAAILEFRKRLSSIG